MINKRHLYKLFQQNDFDIYCYENRMRINKEQKKNNLIDILLRECKELLI